MPIAILGTDSNPLTTRDLDSTPNNFVFVNGRLAFTGAYVVGGDALDWTTVQGIGLPSSICLQTFLEWQGLGNGFFPIGGPSTALNAWKVKVSIPGTFGTELTAIAYAAAILTDVIAFQATFRKLL